jgi:hypothetical protein
MRFEMPYAMVRARSQTEPDAMDRHLGLLTSGAACIYNSGTIKPGVTAEGVELCALPVSKLADITRNKVAQNTLAVGAGLSMMGVGFQALEEVLTEQFKKKGAAGRNAVAFTDEMGVGRQDPTFSSGWAFFAIVVAFDVADVVHRRPLTGEAEARIYFSALWHG